MPQPSFLDQVSPLLGTFLAAGFVLGFVLYLIFRIIRGTKILEETLAKTIEKEKTERDYWRVFKYGPKKRIIRRAGNRCEWFDPDGERCSTTSDLEIDHIYPWAAGGWTIESNAQVLCHAHHLYKGGAVPSENDIKDIENRRKEYFSPNVDFTVRWRPTDEERENHAGKTLE